jgi:hypothetical protein
MVFVLKFVDLFDKILIKNTKSEMTISLSSIIKNLLQKEQNPNLKSSITKSNNTFKLMNKANQRFM